MCDYARLADLGLFDGCGEGGIVIKPDGILSSVLFTAKPFLKQSLKECKNKMDTHFCGPST